MALETQVHFLQVWVALKHSQMIFQAPKEELTDSGLIALESAQN